MGLIEAILDSIKSSISFLFRKRKEKKDLTRRQVLKLVVVYKVITKFFKIIWKIIKTCFKLCYKIIKKLGKCILKFLKFLSKTKDNAYKNTNNSSQSREVDKPKANTEYRNIKDNLNNNNNNTSNSEDNVENKGNNKNDNNGDSSMNSMSVF